VIRGCAFSLCLGPLTLRSAPDAATVPPHGNGLLVLQNIAEVGEGAVELPAVDSLSGLAGVLEGDAEVAAAGASRLCAVNAVGGVANLRQLISHSSCSRLQIIMAAADVPFCREVLWLLVGRKSTFVARVSILERLWASAD
jgi:hypothetical protein